MKYENLNTIRLALVCHEFSPYQGSECREGWNVALNLNLKCDLTVYAASGSQFEWTNYKKHFTKYANENKPFQLKVIFVDQPNFTKIISRINRLFKKFSVIGLPNLYFLGYKIWLNSTISKIKKEKFDVVHLLTSINYREPGNIYKLNNVFWGPTGGLTPLPKSFLKELSIRERIIERIRHNLNLYTLKHRKRLKQSIQNCSKIYCFSKYDKTKMGAYTNKEIDLLPDGLCDDNFSLELLEKKDPVGQIKLVWCGQIIKRKGLDILFKAINKLSDEDRGKISLKIIGDGPLKNKSLKQANSIKNCKIEFTGKINHAEVDRVLFNSHFLIYTSYREASTNIIPQALSNGLGVICHDISGMGLLVNDNCGVKIPLISSENSATKIAEALKKLIANPNTIINFNKNALERSKHFSWEAITNKFIFDYEQSLK